MARIRVGNEELEFVSKSDGIIELEQGQEIPAAIFADELGRVKFRDRDSVSIFMSTLAVLGGNVKQIDAAAGPPSGALPPEVVVYIDLDTLRLYKRTESGWGDGLSLRGEAGQQGQQGERGRTILYGEANPNTRVDLDDALIGDMYAETGPDNNPEHQLWVKKQPAFSSDGNRLLQWERIGRPYGRIPADGAQGQRGRSIFEGTSNPNTPIGLDAVEIASAIDGDLYIETDRFVIWKKIGGAWHERGQSFKGPNGQNGLNGARGNSVYEGTLDPNSPEMQSELSSSQVGDVYINTATYVVWKKKRLTGVQWETSGTTFKGTDGTSGNTIFQGAGVPNDPNTPKPEGFENAKFGDVYLDTTTHKIWKYTSEDPEAHWTTVGEPYRGVSVIQGKGDPNYLALLESEPSNDLLYPDKQYDWFKVRSSNIGDAYFDVDGHDLWKKVLDIENYDETNPLLNKIWVKKGQSLTGPPAETLVLESTSYFIGYDKEGKNPSPQSFTLTANLRNYPESGITYKFGTLSKDESGNIIKTQIDEEIDVNSIDINLMDPETGGEDLSNFFGNPPAPITYYVDIYIGEEFKASDTITVLGVREGSNAINVILSNDSHVFPSDTEGNINQDVYFLGATDIYAYAGAEILDPKSSSDYATSNNCFKVKIKSLNGIKASNQPTNSLATSIEEGQFLSNIESSGGGNFKFICFPFDWTSETKSASIVYEIYIKTSFATGEIILEKTQSFARLNDGNKGRSSLQGTGDPNLISRTIDPFTKTSWGAYSNSTFGVPVAEAERDYEEVLSAVDGDKYIDLRTSLTYINSLKYENTKTVELTVSAPLLSLSLGHLRFSESGDQYFGDGGGFTASSYAIVATPRNHVGTVYYEFLLGSTTLNNSTSNGLSRLIAPPLNTFNSIFGNNNSITYTVRTREGSPTGTVIASDTITLFGTKANSSNVIAHITNDSLTFPFNSDGVISSTEYSNASAISYIFVVEGNERLTPVSAETNLTNSTFKISFISSNISISPTINSFEKRIRIAPSDMTADNASVTYTITAKNSTGQEYTFTKVQTFTISKKAQSIVSTWTQNQVGLLSNVEKKNQSAFSVYRSYVGKNWGANPDIPEYDSIGIWGDDIARTITGRGLTSFQSFRKNCSSRFIDVSNLSGEDYYTISTENISPSAIGDGNEASIELKTTIPGKSYVLLDTRFASRMRAKIRRTPGVNTLESELSWVGRVEFYYKDGTTTQNDYDISRRNTQSLTILDPTKGIGNEWTVIEWDLSLLPAWKNKTILGFKWCIFDKPNNSIDVEWIIFGNPNFSPAITYDSIRQNDTVNGKGWVIPSYDIALFSISGTGTQTASLNRLLRSKSTTQTSTTMKLAPGETRYNYSGIEVSGITINDSNDLSNIRDITATGTINTDKIFPNYLYVNRDAQIGAACADGQSATLDIGYSRTGLGDAKLQFYSDESGNTSSIIRDASAGTFEIKHQGTGNLEFYTNNSLRMSIPNNNAYVNIPYLDVSETLAVKKLNATNRIQVGNTSTAYDNNLTDGFVPNLIVLKQNNDDNQSALIFERANDAASYWKVFNNSFNDLIFHWRGTDLAFVKDNSGAAGPFNDGVNTALNFTGQHKVKPKTFDLFSNSQIGLIVVSIGRYDNTGIANDERDNITINEALPVVALSIKRNQKSVLGVISDKDDPNSSVRVYQIGAFGTFENKKTDDDNRLVINSIGEGAIWITNINGNLENGDYITTCEIPGYGMKQDLESLMNYTVAKITCDCDFDLNSEIYHCEEFEWEGKTYRKAFVGCTYHCG